MIHRIPIALAAAWLVFAAHAVAAPPEVVFHDKKAAAEAILDDGDLAKQRSEFRSRYSGSVLDFSDAEKKMIRAGIERIHPYLKNITRCWPEPRRASSR